MKNVKFVVQLAIWLVFLGLLSYFWTLSQVPTVHTFVGSDELRVRDGQRVDFEIDSVDIAAGFCGPFYLLHEGNEGFIRGESVSAPLGLNCQKYYYAAPRTYPGGSWVVNGTADLEVSGDRTFQVRVTYSKAAQALVFVLLFAIAFFCAVLLSATVKKFPDK